MTELSIIIPFCNEWANIAFTIRAIAEQLIDKADFEIIAVDNFVAGRDCGEPDRGHDHINRRGEHVESHIATVSQFHPWLKYVRYSQRLSHWQAKNAGVRESSGHFLWFMDAHVIPSHNALIDMYQYYREAHIDLSAVMNLPLTYSILEKQRLIYQMDIDEEIGKYHYRFRNYDGKPSEIDCKIFEVPVMSLCGMLMTREIFDMLGGFPATLGIYGGGENFVNFTLALIGIAKYIYPWGTLFHHGDARGYSYNYDDYHKNRMTAVYFHSGLETAFRYAKNNFRVSERKIRSILEEIDLRCRDHRRGVMRHQTDELDAFIAFWMDQGEFVFRGDRK